MIPSKHHSSNMGDQSAAGDDVSYAGILANLDVNQATWAPGELLHNSHHDSTHAFFGFYDSWELAEIRGVPLCNAYDEEGEGNITRELEEGIEGNEGAADRPWSETFEVLLVPTKGPAPKHERRDASSKPRKANESQNSRARSK